MEMHPRNNLRVEKNILVWKTERQINFHSLLFGSINCVMVYNSSVCTLFRKIHYSNYVAISVLRGLCVLFSEEPVSHSLQQLLNI